MGAFRHRSWCSLAAALSVGLVGCARPPAGAPAAQGPAISAAAATTAAGVTKSEAIGSETKQSETTQSRADATSGGAKPGLPTPAGPLGVPVRLTEPGCCARPFWRADSKALWFIDKPEGGATGFYEITLDRPLAPPVSITNTITSLSPDQRWSVLQSRERTTITRLTDGATVDLPSAGRSVIFSPDGERIAWQVGGGPDNAGGGPPTDPSNRIFVAAVDGSKARELTRLADGSIAGWLDDATLLVRVREGRDSDVSQLITLPLNGSEGREILKGERLRGVAFSSDRSWLAYSISGAASPGANGLWIAATGAGAAPPRRLDGRFGAFRWRDGRRLVIIPFEPGAASHRLVELDASSGAERPLSDPIVAPFRIADGDWSLSPDGRHMAFVNAADDAIWTLALP